MAGRKASSFKAKCTHSLQEAARETPRRHPTHATIAEIAEAEKINESYVGRVLRLTLLAPDIVEAILVGRQPTEMTLAGLMGPLPVVWGKQRRCGERITRLGRKEARALIVTCSAWIGSAKGWANRAINRDNPACAKNYPTAMTSESPAGQVLTCDTIGVDLWFN
jgi:hypothetical protein